MADVVELPFQFFQVYCDGFHPVVLKPEVDSDFDLESADLEEFRGEAAVLRERAEEDGVLPELKLALEYLASIDDDDIPENKHNVGVIGEFVDTCLSGFMTPELHRLFEWARGVNFPDEPPMSTEDKERAKKRVLPVEVDIDEWMEARGLERSSKPGVRRRRDEARKRKQEEQP
jgi:hypothetical protein